MNKDMKYRFKMLAISLPAIIVAFVVIAVIDWDGTAYHRGDTVMFQNMGMAGRLLRELDVYQNAVHDNNKKLVGAILDTSEIYMVDAGTKATYQDSEHGASAVLILDGPWKGESLWTYVTLAKAK